MEDCVLTIKNELQHDRVKMNVEHEMNKFEVESLIIKEREALKIENENKVNKEIARVKEILEQEFEFKV